MDRGDDGRQSRLGREQQKRNWLEEEEERDNIEPMALAL